MSFQLDPSLPFAEFVNPKIAFSQSKGIDYWYNQIIQSYPGDPQAGLVTPGTTIPWDKTSETAGLIWEYYYTQAAAQNMQDPLKALPADLTKIMTDNAGPDEMWNFSYEQWGIVPGVSGEAKQVNAVEIGTGRLVSVIAPKA